MNTDFLLIGKAKNGSGQAGEQFIKKHYSSIYQYCFLHMRDCNLAEDMTQETFTRFLNPFIRIRIMGKAGTIYTVLPEISLRTITKRKKRYQWKKFLKCRGMI